MAVSFAGKVRVNSISPGWIDTDYTVYEGPDAKGRIKRSFQIVNNLEAAKYYNGKTSQTSLVPTTSKEGFALKCILRTGTMVLFYENKPEELYECGKEELVKRLYKLVKMSKNGQTTFSFHQEARNDEGLKTDYEKENGTKGSLTNGYSSVDFQNPHPKLLLTPGNMDMLVEGHDFILTVTGEIKFNL